MKVISKTGLMAAATGAVCLVGTSAAVAAIPHHNGSISGCYTTSTGALRVVKSATHCTKHEKPLTWNVQGQRGATGARGVAGANGAPGAGVPGPQGPPGTGHYAYFYSTMSQLLDPGEPVRFEGNGPASGGIAELGDQVIVDATGDYLVNFSVSGTAPNQFSLMRDRVAVPGAAFSSDEPDQTTTGQVIVHLVGGETLSVENTSYNFVDLDPAGGPAAGASSVIASVLVEQLS